MTTSKQRTDFAARIRQYDIIINNEKNISYGVQWKVSWHDETATVNTYHGKKGFRLVVQGATPMLKELLEKAFAESGNVMASLLSAGRGNNEHNLQNQRIIGCDESGKGDILGPLAVAAVNLGPIETQEIASWGVRDSKQLTDVRITALAKRFLEKFSDFYTIICLSPCVYNELYEKYETQGKNLNHLLTDLHFKNIETLCHKLPAGQVILDRFAPEEMMNQRFRAHNLSVPLLQVPRGEKYIEVAMASILARFAFIRGMEALSAKYEITLPKGAGSSVLVSIDEIVHRYGKEVLNEVGKLHFKTFDSYR